MKDFDSKLLKIRCAKAGDMRAVAEIYRHEVVNCDTVWEETPPNISEINQRRKNIQNDGFPYFVAHLQNRLIGFTYAYHFRPRFGYRYTVESSIYVATDMQRIGIGQLMMAELINACTQKGFRQMLAVVGDSRNLKSINFHKKIGFRRIAILNSIGFRSERWLDSVIMGLSLGDGDTTQPTN